MTSAEMSGEDFSSSLKGLTIVELMSKRDSIESDIKEFSGVLETVSPPVLSVHSYSDFANSLLSIATRGWYAGITSGH